MDKQLAALLIEEGSKLLSDIIRVAYPRPKATKIVPYIPRKSVKPSESDVEYRHECVLKHLGGASVLLREAYERANDEGIGDGTAEKIVEAMNEHAGAEPDLEKMIPSSNAEVKRVADHLLSGIRSFRKAAWESKLPTGGGTKQDIEDARLWNTIMLKEAMDAAKKYPGTECIKEGL